MRFHILLGQLAGLFAVASAVEVTSSECQTIGTDIQGSERFNGVSFQEDAILSYGDYQYVTFYETAPGGNNSNHLVQLGRRRMTPTVGTWQFLTFEDYIQNTQDGHNIISMGISGDGKIHLSFDHHVSRKSPPGKASSETDRTG